MIALYGNRNSSGTFPFQTTATEGGLYGAGRFAYSTNQFSASVDSSGSGTYSDVTDFSRC